MTEQKPSEAEPKPVNKLSIRLGEHWAIVGATGSGKTYFATRGLLEYLRRMFPTAKRYVLDTSADEHIARYVHEPRVHEGDKIPPLLESPLYTSIWTPYVDNEEHYERYLDSILRAREPAIVLIDEIANLVGYSKSAEPPDAYIRLIKQGRKHKITVVTGTQSIQRVPEPVFTQMTHYAQFRIGASRYAASMARQYLNHSEEEQRNPFGKYGFWYRRVDGNYAAREFAGLSSFFKFAPL